MKKRSILAIIVCLALFSCAGLGINLDTTEKKYLAARTELNLFLEQYIMIQDKVSDVDHEKAKLAFKSADAALDAWEPMVGMADYDWTKDMAVWLNAKNILINILTEVK
jgi:hypothetical protein